MTSATIIRVKAAILFAFFLATPGLAQQAEADKNPLFLAWSRAKLGSEVKHTGSSKSMGIDATVETTTRLAAVNADSVVVEIERTVSTPKQTPRPERLTQTILAAQPNPPLVRTTAVADLSVGGKSVRCTVYESNTKSGDMQIVTRYFMSDDIPGGVVRIEGRTDGPISMTTTIELVEFKSP